MTISDNDPTPVYQQLAAILEDRIRSRDLAGRMPGERALAEEYGCAYRTVRRSMEILRDKGLVQTVHGRGTFAVPQ